MVAENEEVGTISDDLVVTKYKMAAEITNSKFDNKVQRGINIEYNRLWLKQGF